jgi:hypothetical protein
VFLYRVDEFRASPRADFEPLPRTANKRFSGEKQLVLVRGPATLAVAPEDRDVASLLYNGTAFDRGLTIADGDPSVTFSRCGRRVAQYAGAFVVARARCVRLLVSDADGRQVADRRIPFGLRRC